MNFGIVGTGLIAEFHAKALKEIPGARIVACLDKVPERAQAFSKAHGCAAYDNLGEFLAHKGLETVNICTPSGLHLDAAGPAAAAGKHLVIEKPLETTRERCAAIVEACRSGGVTLAGIFPSRFHGSASAIKAAVDAGRFGKLTMGSAYVKWWRDQEYYSKGGWKGTKALDGGGALINQSIHAVDLLLWFMGDADEVCAWTGTIGHQGIEVEDNAVASIRFKNGALGVIQGSTAVWPGFLKRVEVSGLAGSAIMEEENLLFWKFKDESPADQEIRQLYASATSSGGGASDPAAIGYHGHKLQFLDFIDAVEKGRKPLVDGVEAAKAVCLIEAIYQSAESGRPVKVKCL
ncbi:MAG: Gfo/Idh/MocA family oxidoreductase [Spirochaetia bacterium]|jgi:predicted dehydrogenase|nr:Gfo/Idh/MocA family oxidoreductase [Spirochaetia bacterium]